jgi:hypothetical protein
VHTSKYRVACVGGAQVIVIAIPGGIYAAHDRIATVYQTDVGGVTHLWIFHTSGWEALGNGAVVLWHTWIVHGVGAHIGWIVWINDTCVNGTVIAIITVSVNPSPPIELVALIPCAHIKRRRLGWSKHTPFCGIACVYGAGVVINTGDGWIRAHSIGAYIISTQIIIYTEWCVGAPNILNAYVNGTCVIIIT